MTNFNAQIEAESVKNRTKDSVDCRHWEDMLIRVRKNRITFPIQSSDKFTYTRFDKIKFSKYNWEKQFGIQANPFKPGLSNFTKSNFDNRNGKTLISNHNFSPLIQFIQNQFNVSRISIYPTRRSHTSRDQGLKKIYIRMYINKITIQNQTNLLSSRDRKWDASILCIIMVQ